jgi:hypothetical protein
MKNDILIAYYSWSGNTRTIAELIGREIGGTLFEIEPAKPYSTNYGAVVEQAKEEIRTGFRPNLGSMTEINSYKTVFLGSPIWWHTMATPLRSRLPMLFPFTQLFMIKLLQYIKRLLLDTTIRNQTFAIPEILNFGERTAW